MRMGWFSRPPSAWEKNRRAGVCPDCGSSEVTVLCQVYGWSYNVELAAVSVIGFRLSCQRCPCVFSVNGNGSFRQHSKSLPWTPNPVVLDESLKQANATTRAEAYPPPRPPGAVNDPLPLRFPHAR